MKNKLKRQTIPIPDYIADYSNQTISSSVSQNHENKLKKCLQIIIVIFLHTVDEWKSLPCSIYNSKTVECFKNCIKNV